MAASPSAFVISVAELSAVGHWPTTRRAYSVTSVVMIGYVKSGELIAAQLPQVLGMYQVADGSQLRACSRETPLGHQLLGQG